MKKLLLIAVALFSGYTFLNSQHGSALKEVPFSLPEQSTSNKEVPSSLPEQSTSNKEVPSSLLEQSTSNSDVIIANAFSNHTNNLQISGQGVVTRLLPDDSSGSRHQKFIIKLPSGQTLLIAHNIDLAPRISSLREGDSVEFFGEYEWNEKGGVLHWTHLDPNGSHVAGWLQHQGQKYQ